MTPDLVRYILTSLAHSPLYYLACAAALLIFLTVEVLRLEPPPAARHNPNPE